MGSRMQAVVVPLACHETQSKWFVFSNQYGFPDCVQSVFEKGQLLITDPKGVVSDGNMGVLMHVPENTPDMARSGVLVKREGDQWQPVSVNVGGRLYLLEIKGVGSPVGGFSSIHPRTQAGSKKTHNRVTGGMTQGAMENECQSLLKVQSHYDWNLPGIVPIACIAFEIHIDGQLLNMGMLLRLTPSNIRYSYGEFGDFKSDRPDVYEQFSNINDRLFKAGLRHQNLTANNLVYLDDHQYVVTDYEECTSIYAVPASLDVNTRSEPLFLKIYPFRFQENLQYKTPDVGLFYNQQDMEKECDSLFKSSYATLLDYIGATKRFMLPGYDTLPLKQWVLNRLMPNLYAQILCLEQAMEWRGDNQLNVKALIHQFVGYDANNQNNQSGLFCFEVPMASLFLKNLAGLSRGELNDRIKHIRFVLRQLEQCIAKDDWFYVSGSYNTSVLYMVDSYGFWDAPVLLFPFLPWVTQWFGFLQDYYGMLMGKHHCFNMIQQLHHVNELYEVFKECPEQILQHLTQNGR